MGSHRPASRTGGRSCGRTVAPPTAADALAEAGHLDLVRRRTGLVLDPYFSGTKYEWLLTEGGVPVDERLALGTIDSWIVWNLTGGERHVTDVSNASRTMLFDIGTLRWDEELADLLHVPLAALPEVVAVLGPGRARRRSGSASPPASRSAASPATSRRPCSGSRACGREWPRTPTAPAASSCSTSARSARRRRTGC